MADWKDDYQQGSFRGVEFKTKSHTFDSGRHNVDHEFPSKEEGNSEDLGKRLPTFKLDLYVLGDDYFEQRDKLIKALDEEGEGTLVHPYLGTKQVQVGKYTVSESTDEGRIARFSVEFSTSGTPKFPAEATDGFQSVLDKASALLDSAMAALETGFSVANTPARVTEAAIGMVSDAADLVGTIAQKVGNTAQGVANVAYAVKNLKSDAAALVKVPGQLAQRFVDAFELLFDAVEDFKTLSLALDSNTGTFEPEPIVGRDTPTTQRLQGNALAMSNFVLNVSVANQARAAVQGSFVSVEESVYIRDLINAQVDRQLDSITDDQAFQDIKDLQAAANLALPPQDVGEVVKFTNPVTLPALVISQRLFGGISKEQEIIDQNKIEHPGFVPGNLEITVTSAL